MASISATIINEVKEDLVGILWSLKTAALDTRAAWLHFILWRKCGQLINVRVPTLCVAFETTRSGYQVNQHSKE